MSDHTGIPRPSVGVLAMQGAFARHVDVLQRCGARAFEVRTAEQLASCDAIVLPGGESTAIRKALVRAELLEPLRARIEAGMPTLGTCAGLIVLAHAPSERRAAGTPACLGLLDVDVERNGFGRQVHSAERAVQLTDGETLPGVFIRAPRITRVGEDVTVLGTLEDGEPVLVRQGSLLGATFHPELTTDARVHELLCRAALDAVAATSAGPARLHD